MMRVTVTRSFTYDVEEIKNSIRQINNDPEQEVTDDEVLELIESWVQEDMRSPISRHELIYTDDEGQEL